jgi:hypothetical protein
MAEEIERIWRCGCHGGHFVSLSWDPDDLRGPALSAEGYLALEGDWRARLRQRISGAWRLLVRGEPHSWATVLLDEAKAREIAGALTEFADSAAADR